MRQFISLNEGGRSSEDSGDLDDEEQEEGGFE